MMFPPRSCPVVAGGVLACLVAFALLPVRAENPPEGAPAAAENPKPEAAPAPAPPPAGRRAPAKVGLEQIEIESQFFEVPEDVAQKLELISTIPNPEKPDAGAAAGAKRKVAPARPKLNSVMMPEAVKEFLQKLQNTKGANLVCAPRLVTRSGQRAVIEMIREFRYATEFQIDKGGGNPIPSAFETRNLGVTLEVNPESSEGAIDLELIPQIVEFEGFMNANDMQPLPLAHGIGIGANMTLKDFGTTKIPRGAILQPVFSTRKVNFNVTLLSGQSVLVGGLKREEGDEKRVTRMLYVLVTARCADRPRRGDEKFADALPVALINPADEPGYVRSPYAPEGRPVDARDLPSGTELKCPVTRKLFRLP